MNAKTEALLHRLTKSLFAGEWAWRMYRTGSRAHKVCITAVDDNHFVYFNLRDDADPDRGLCLVNGRTVPTNIGERILARQQALPRQHELPRRLAA